MILSRYTVKNIKNSNVQNVPLTVFALPEKILQFGTGVLLRGLPDYYVDNANKQNIFNGRIVVVKSTDGGDKAAFDLQDGLYTLCVRGIEHKKSISENIICTSISRVLSAKEEWNEILKCAHNPEMQIIISNTTEVGIELVKDDINHHPPISYPGKLLAFLLERYNAFAGSTQCGMIIVPTELISDNGKKLESIVLELAHLNGLNENFIEWLEKHNRFCNSLVDRIVTGKPNNQIKKELEEELGYQDDLITMCEVYHLWAIEGDETVANILNFANANSGMIIAPNINLFKELKLRLLNGTHTLTCAIALLSQVNTVKKAMDNNDISTFIKELMCNEIAKAMLYNLPEKEAQIFAEKILERFSNSSIEHYWINISLNFTAKLEMRVIAVLLNYYKLYNHVPEHIALGFAAYIVFMQPVISHGNIYYGKLNTDEYPLKDSHAPYFFNQWNKFKIPQIVENILGNTDFWHHDLNTLPNFTKTVTKNVEDIIEYGMIDVLKNRKAILI